MVALALVKEANAKLMGQYARSGQPFVAVMAGGTAGIGAYAVHELAKTYGRAAQAFGAEGGTSAGLRIYIVGRNAEAAENLIASCRMAYPKGVYRFVKAQDLALVQDANRCAANIIAMENEEASLTEGGKPKVDFVLASQGILSFASRKETSEGIDNIMALYFYSRLRFAVTLLPLMLNSTSPSGARFISVLNPRAQGPIDTNNLSCRDPRSSLFNRLSAVGYLKRFFMEGLAAQHPDKLSFCHHYPGYVRTGAIEATGAPTIVKLLFKYVIDPLLRPFSYGPEESGQRTLYMAGEKFPAAKFAESHKVERESLAMGSDGNLASGVYMVGSTGDAVPFSKAAAKFREAGAVDIATKHTMEAFEQTEARGVFRN